MATRRLGSSIAKRARSTDSDRMLEKLKNRLRRSGPDSAGPASTAGEQLRTARTGGKEIPIPEPKGHDAKALAERKADIAGEKWRREAEASGEKAVEVGGPKGLEPTRYGDWEKAGRCIDF